MASQKIFGSVEHQQRLGAVGKDRAGPGRERPFDRHVERSRHVAARERLRPTCIEDHRAAVAELGEQVHGERGWFGDHAEHLGSRHVLRSHPSPVRRHTRERREAEHLVDGTPLEGPRDHRVGSPLVADGRGEPRADGAAAQRTGHVRGIDLDVVGQGEDPLLERAQERLRALTRGLIATEEVGPGHVVHQECPAGEEDGGLVAHRTVADEEADVLGRVTGSVEDLERDLPHLEHLAVRERTVGVAVRSGARRQRLDARNTGDQLADPRQVVVVPMRVEHVGDPHPPVAGFVQVRGDVSPWVEDERLTGPLVADEVRRVAEALEVELPQMHDPTLPNVRGTRASASRGRRAGPCAVCRLSPVGLEG